MNLKKVRCKEIIGLTGNSFQTRGRLGNYVVLIDQPVETYTGNAE